MPRHSNRFDRGKKAVG